MKKTYIQPVSEVIEMKYKTMLMAGSDLGVASGTLDADQSLSRGFDFSEDYDFDEE